mmetsp:Transcript_12115/g.28027  ORF Transcript_12115/g.28027 Transcript_12115/m.28027 type:complete len:220 (+) Transcript_12115:454-1113(+)
MRSLQADFKWYDTKLHTRGQKKVHSRFGRVLLVLHWIMIALQHFILLVLGVPTFGWTWPSNLRRLFVGNNYYDPDDTTSNLNKLDRLGDSLAYLSRAVASEADPQNLPVGDDDQEPQECLKEKVIRVEEKLDGLILSLKTAADAGAVLQFEDTATNERNSHLRRDSVGISAHGFGGSTMGSRRWMAASSRSVRFGNFSAAHRRTYKREGSMEDSFAEPF